MTPKQKAWLIVICTAVSSGTGVAALASKGGCSLGWSIAAGVGSGASAVLHSLLTSPNDAENKPTTP